MEKFPDSIQFKYPWRDYQSRVLAELETHLSDDHLHLIAPPGSGKTILGLEVMLRLNKPTLILAPSIAIRNQWIHRFCELFLQTSEVPDWISHDIKAPKFLTVATYQALHAVYRGLPEEEGDLIESPTAAAHAIDLPKILKARGVQTIIADEAHHLKNAWWKSLMNVKNELDTVIVGLTATPPYDVPYAEWKRYLELNGPVDTEISVPELVAAGDLAPHQDFVYFSEPTESEADELAERKKRIDEFYEEICGDEELLQVIQSHKFFTDAESSHQEIFKNVESYSSMIIYMNHAGVEIEKETLDIIAVKRKEIPDLDLFWMESLLQFFLFGKQEQFDAHEDLQKRIVSRLRKCSALERTSINLVHNKKSDELLNKSITKLDSIGEIVATEHRALGDKLRMVILTDYIRKEFLAKSESNDFLLTKMGVVPIFESLRRSTKNTAKLGVLSGSLVFLPASALPTFEDIASNYASDSISAKTLPFDTDYVSISLTQAVRKNIVHIVTQIFERGEVEVLIGTQALLGEGWDAPSINALILASTIGSYVSSNQMRGRAIRTNPSTPNKTANIWHLVCLDPYDKKGRRRY
ncbi:DEAD/DEAH box helicase family protein [Phaeocystidibacter luteus]|uniref:Helicase ATP-binding domain-containing protein n=1 Tax=Phaeocystidibacter luteus TaxID=911197 RepID=A0A6N6RHM5_9FLAO|nr:DEAD/DEAH box helicase family protein [Phaeocystidibacter luteus]KAB2809970.1 hypothetical protein F8C67_08810 [Phaeocystidibacter luteus]